MLRQAALLLVAALGWIALAAAPAPATRSLAAEEKLSCDRCHPGRRARRLSDLGLFYELMRTTAGYQELKERFARCSHCHQDRPGSRRLTREGRRYQWFFEDMDGIRAWVMDRHPAGPPIVVGEPEPDEDGEEAKPKGAEDG